MTRQKQITAPEMSKTEQRYWEARERGNRAFCDGVAYENCPYGDAKDEDAWRTGWRECEDEARAGKAVS